MACSLLDFVTDLDTLQIPLPQVLSTGAILVWLRDFGNEQTVTLKQIYPLEGTLADQPFYAVRCSLNNVAPCNARPLGKFPKKLVTW